MQEEIEFEKKIDKKKEAARKKKKERKQEAKLNVISEGAWQRLGAFTSWVGYRVQLEERSEVIPVRRNASTLELINVISNFKRVIKKEKRMESEQKKKIKRTRKKRTL